MGQYTSFQQDSMASSTLTDALLVPDTGIVIDKNSIAVQYGTYSGMDAPTTVSSISLYTAENQDGLSIGNGLLLSSGTANPPQSNTQTYYSTDLTPVGSGSTWDASTQGDEAKVILTGITTDNASVIAKYDSIHALV